MTLKEKSELEMFVEALRHGTVAEREDDIFVILSSTGSKKGFVRTHTLTLFK